MAPLFHRFAGDDAAAGTLEQPNHMGAYFTIPDL